MKNLRKHFFQLKIDLTRKCNLNCKFCMRGNSQNKDISTEIIDKLISEIKNFYFVSIQVSGGEPFLNPEMFSYLIDKLIENKIVFRNFNVYTNGTIKSEIIRNSLKKITQYLDFIDKEYSEYFEVNKHFCSNMYQKNEQSKVFVVISTYQHNTDIYDSEKAVNFYTINKEKNMEIHIQDSSISDNAIYLCGNAFDNYKELLPSKVNIENYKMNGFSYDFIKNFNYSKYSLNPLCDVFINKTIGISTNGNVYNGCGLSYEEIDYTLPMFNIMQCQNDLYSRIDNWCWENPVNYKISSIRNKKALYNFFVNNGYQTNFDEVCVSLMNAAILYADMHEYEAKKLHKKYPNFSHNEIDLITSAKIPLMLLNKGIDREYVKGYLLLCTIFPNEIAQIYTPQFFKAYIDDIFNNHRDFKNRQKVVADK